MNVRFFGGRKEEYVSIPKHNPIGLYFCADTRELFLGDRLLSDGMRVVSTFADLPSISEHKAAEGVIYFVAETKNGYVLPRGGHDWLQVIYAPEAGSSTKAISFAGIEMEEVDGVFTIDRRCAREALGFIVPDGMEDEEIELVSKEYVDSQIAKIPGADLDLSDFVKQEDIAGLATKEELATAIESIEHPTVDLTDYATEEFVIRKIAEAELADQDVDLSAYYTKSETETAIKSAVDSVEVPDVSGFATKEELEAVQAVAGNNSVKLFAVDEELFDIKQQLENIPTTDLSDYATKEEVAAIEAKIPSIEGLATKEELEEAISGIEHPAVDLEGYATEDWVNAQGFLKEHQDLSEYAKKADIPEAELFVIDFNNPDFVAALRAYNSGKLLLLANAAPDVNSYAVMNYIREDMITFTKFLMSRSGTYGSFNTYYLHNDNSWELAKEVKLNKVEAVADASKINGITIGKETYTFDYATTETVNQINQSIQNIENTYVTNETLEQKNYVTEQHITKNYITIQDAADTYVTNEQVTEVVTNEVETVVTEQIETKVTEVIQEKVDAGEIAVEVTTDRITYGEF